MKLRKLIFSAFAIASSLSLFGAFWSAIVPGLHCGEAEARRHHARSTHQAATQHSHHSRHSGQTHHARGKKSAKVAQAKPKHAYPLDFFMMKAPDFDRSPLEEDLAGKLQDAFSRGIADNVPPEKLVRAGVFHHYPLSGGIFKRREAVKYIVLHSTETGIAVPGKNVINGWNSMGRRHPGAQFVVDRDGTIYQALDPELAAVHVNIFKTLPGINNDNTIGIEMNHTGRQDYPAAQRQAVMRLLCYLQHRFSVTSDNVITHRYAQQGDHTDPVNFDLENFLSQKEDFRVKALVLKGNSAPLPFDEETEDDAPLASVYVQIHEKLPELTANSKEPQISKSENKSRTAAAAASSAGSATVLNSAASTGTAGSAAPIAMPKGTFVAGGPLGPDDSPATENRTGQ